VAKRSPILGFNHNIRHRGLVFHVQTEDSGVANPHIFTHLFHGGVILSTRKLVYDPDSADDVVKALMQSQHKAVLKELKGGAFTDKINQYLGNHPDLLPFEASTDGGAAEKTEPTPLLDPSELAAPPSGRHDTQVGPPPEAVEDDRTEPVVMPPEATRLERPPRRKTTTGEVAQVHSPAPPSAPDPPGMEKGGTYAQHRQRKSGSSPVLPPAPPRDPPPTRPITPRPPRTPSRPAAPAPAPAGKSGGVVVSRPAVIVGAPPRVVGSPGSKDTQRLRSKTDAGRKPDSLFGQGLISEKSLDEVILAYLSEDGEDE